MKKKISGTIAIVLMLVLAFTMTPNISYEASAASGGPAIVMGSSVLAQNVSKDGLQKIWFGRYLDPPTRIRMWYVIGYDGQGDNPASRKNLITILHRNIRFGGGERFSGNSNESYANQYSVANIRWIVNSYYNGIGDWKWNNSKEKGIIVKRTLEGGSSNYGEAGYDENKIKGNSVEDAGFWLLSCGEAEALPGGIRHLGANNTWWLRSPGEFDGEAAYCWTDFNYNYTVVIKDGVSSDTYHGVRPACDLNMDDILFTSAAEGGKASGSGADALTGVGNNKNDEWKLTIKDAGRNSFDITACEGSYDSSSGSVTFRYSGAKVESNSYISAIIVGSDDSIKYYGRVADVSDKSAASGQVTVNTSGKIESGDRLFVFNEQYNGDKITDYASELKEIALPSTGEHEWTEATCVNPATCEICGTRAGEALGHRYQEEVEDSAKAPTCTEAGKEADLKCTGCGDVVAGAEIAAYGHDWIVDGTTDPDGWKSWTTDGVTIHEKRTCRRCGSSEQRDYESGHVHNSAPMSIDPGNPVTCTTDGTEEHFVCSCGYLFKIGPDGSPVVDEPMSSDDFVIPALGHDWEAATCTEPKTCKRCSETIGSPLMHDRQFTGWTWVGNETKGYTEAIASYECVREGCGSVRMERITPKKRVVPPTCTESGKTIYRAQISSTDAPDFTTRSSEKEANFIDPTGHTWGEWEITKQATDSEEGEKQRECEVCGFTEEEKIPPTPAPAPAPTPAPAAADTPLTIDSGTVSAGTLNAALAKTGGSADSVTTIILGKGVKKISKGAFNDFRNADTLVVRSKKLKKAKVKKSLKGSSITRVKVEVGNKKTNKKYVKKYKKIFTKKNAGKKVKVTL